MWRVRVRSPHALSANNFRVWRRRAKRGGIASKTGRNGAEQRVGCLWRGRNAETTLVGFSGWPECGPNQGRAAGQAATTEECPAVFKPRPHIRVAEQIPAQRRATRCKNAHAQPDLNWRCLNSRMAMNVVKIRICTALVPVLMKVFIRRFCLSALKNRLISRRSLWRTAIVVRRVSSGWSVTRGSPACPPTKPGCVGRFSRSCAWH